MNRFSNFMLAILATVLLTTSACKQAGDSAQPTPIDNTPGFVGRQLIMTSFQVNPAIDLDGDGKLDTDLMVFLRDCDKDNTLVFKKNGTLSGSNGQPSCAEGEADPSAVGSSHWTYNESTKTIKIIKDNDATDVSEWKVIDESATGLTVEIAISEPSRSYKTIMRFSVI